MKINLDSQNQIVIDVQHGCKIESLKLNGKYIIINNNKQPFLSYGSYLMFPWVNRVKFNPYNNSIKNQYFDGKQYPLHGIFMDKKRQINIIKSNQKQLNLNNQNILIQIKNSYYNQQIHSFQEKFILKKGTLQIYFKVIQNLNDKLPYCFGYHPYFQFQNKNISNLKFKTNLIKQLKLTQQLIPLYPHQQVQWNGIIDQNSKYDSLFQGKKSQNQNLNFIQITDGQKILKIESDLQYWQIYTPPDGKRIAIQPMSFHGNLYECCQINHQVKKEVPNKGYLKISIQ